MAAARGTSPTATSSPTGKAVPLSRRPSASATEPTAGSTTPGSSAGNRRGTLRPGRHRRLLTDSGCHDDARAAGGQARPNRTDHQARLRLRRLRNDRRARRAVVSSGHHHRHRRGRRLPSWARDLQSEQGSARHHRRQARRTPTAAHARTLTAAARTLAVIASGAQRTLRLPMAGTYAVRFTAVGGNRKIDDATGTADITIRPSH